MEPRELLAPLVLLELLVSPDQEEDLDLRDLRVLLDQEDFLVILVLRVLRVTLAPKENPVTLVLRDLPELKVRRVREDPLVRLALMGLLETVGLEVLPEVVACLVRMEEVARLVCLVPVVPLVLLDLVDPLEMLVVLASLALPVSEVSQEALEAPDHQERRDLLVLLD